jgi:SAM-dependent methyltransferase
VDLSERTADAAAAGSRRHPWEVARAAFLLDVLQGEGGLQTPAGFPARVLDVGSGDAYVARSLLARVEARVCCWDLHFTDDDLASLARIHGVTPSRQAPEGTFDAALLLDVIEHVEDDVALVADVAARVRPGGFVLVSVPAWPALFSAHDVALHHHRRYSPAACRDVVARAGLDIVQSGGFFHGLIAPRAAAVAIEKVAGRKPARAGVGGWNGGDVVTGAIVAALRAEQVASAFFARRGVDVPGLSFFALCRVPHLARAGAR